MSTRTSGCQQLSGLHRLDDPDIRVFIHPVDLEDSSWRRIVAAIDRITWRANVGVSCTRNRKALSSITASTVGSRATAVRLRASSETMASSPNVAPGSRVSSTRSPLRSSMDPEITPYIS